MHQGADEPQRGPWKLGKAHVADIDRDHQRIQCRTVIASAHKCTPSGRQPDAVRLGVIKHQLGCVETAGDVDIVVVTPQQKILAEKEILNLAR